MVTKIYSGFIDWFYNHLFLFSNSPLVSTLKEQVKIECFSFPSVSVYVHTTLKTPENSWKDSYHCKYLIHQHICVIKRKKTQPDN